MIYECTAIVKYATLCLFTSLIIYLCKIISSYSYFKKRNIITPKYRLIFGNLFDLIKNRNDSETVQNWTKELGETYGYFEGHTPILVTTDLEIIQEVFIKQFNNFSARKKLPLEGKDSRKTISLIRANKNRWKRMRLIMNPTFSSAKLREMGPLVVNCVEKLIQQVERNLDLEINFASYLKRFTMDTIWNCAFGVDIDLQNNPYNEYLEKSEKTFSIATQLKFMNLLSLLFYELDFILIPISNLIYQLKLLFGGEKDPRLWILSEIDYILNRRKNENITRRDYMQLLVEATADDDFSFQQNDHKDLGLLNLDKKLTPDEVRANLVLFMLAGYETTSTALTYATYVLATHFEEQQKLFDEIESFCSKEADFKLNIENVKELKNLDMFCKEVLRFYPIARTIRRCINETTIKGIQMTPGLVVRIDHFSIHFSSDLWGPQDPYVFDPSRHDTKRHALSFLAFGLGPRNCIGMKFALLEMKLALANLVRNFVVLPSEKTPKKLDYIEGIVRSPKGGINVILKRRTISQEDLIKI